MQIAVTGHRLLGLDAAGIERLRGVVRGLLQELEGPRAPGELPVLLSGLAFGADQLVAEEALALGWRLTAVLPLPEAAYGEIVRADEAEPLPGGLGYETLRGRASECILVPGTSVSAPVEAYFALVGLLIGLADVVLAVCDEGRAEGGRGGTEDGVAMAVAHGRRVVLVNPRLGLVQDDRQLGLELTQILGAQDAAIVAADQDAAAAKVVFHQAAWAVAAGTFLAVLLATLSLLVEGAAGLGFVEILVILGTVGAVLWERRSGRKDRWLASRTRAELLQRDRCLFLAGGGPFAHGSDREATRAGRVAVLDARRADILRCTLPDVPDAFAQAFARLAHGADALATVSPYRDPALIAWYRRERIAGQRQFFDRQYRAARRSAHRFHNAVIFGFVLAFIGVLWRFFDHDGRVASTVGPALAIVGPSFAAAMAAVAALRGDATHAWRYRAARMVLDEMSRFPAAPDFVTRDWVEETEGFLLAELLAWRADAQSRDLQVG